MSGARHSYRLVVLALAAVLAACASPNPALYTIAPVSGPEKNNACLSGCRTRPLSLVDAGGTSPGTADLSHQMLRLCGTTG